MRTIPHAVGRCECGRDLELQRATGHGPHREIACSCARRHEIEYGAGGWSVVAQLNPERSLPLSGFSKELRQSDDAERFWFTFPLHGEVSLPVHVLFSRSAKRAEVKAADLKVFQVEGVSLPTEARRRWIGWWRGSHATRRKKARPVVVAPRRVGRLPVILPRRRPLALAGH